MGEYETSNIFCEISYASFAKNKNTFFPNFNFRFNPDQDSQREDLKQGLLDQLAALKEAQGSQNEGFDSRLQRVEEGCAECRGAAEELVRSVDTRLEQLIAETTEKLAADRSELQSALASLEEDSSAKIADLQKGGNYSFLCQYLYLGNKT